MSSEPKTKPDNSIPPPPLESSVPPAADVPPWVATLLQRFDDLSASHAYARDIIAKLVDEFGAHRADNSRRLQALERRVDFLENTRVLLPALPGFVSLIVSLVTLLVMMNAGR